MDIIQAQTLYPVAVRTLRLVAGRTIQQPRAVHAIIDGLVGYDDVLWRVPLTLSAAYLVHRGTASPRAETEAKERTRRSRRRRRRGDSSWLWWLLAGRDPASHTAARTAAARTTATSWTSERAKSVRAWVEDQQSQRGSDETVTASKCRRRQDPTLKPRLQSPEEQEEQQVRGGATPQAVPSPSSGTGNHPTGDLLLYHLGLNDAVGTPSW
ncbi:hypothetical protein FA10DRAFT_288638 [Acaromyces ingoldii]|uniref:Uncharacterized protein n=1 Tax=Acaromyces ingoldii TaxID=215250 RepID=A0A316YFG6_9BASI|nr:hypothetical protein FA10DRAFT_288638 [Acaromyces ingoldii]PWN87942.1 hypothetical protein FA10DRAFT_288638 [Acaromyces ingoldii]